MPTDPRAPAEIRAPAVPMQERVLTPDALRFVGDLVRQFSARREELLAQRKQVEARIQGGVRPDFLPETASVRAGSWKVATAPPALQNRRVEITGPVDAKMMINALNSGAQAFMADFEDALSPPWANVVAGQANCIDAVRHALEFVSPEGKRYRLNEEIATLLVRPRGWHLIEKHVSVDGEPAPAGLVDFALYFFHNARESLARGRGPYFYLPKLESYLEARLWNDVFIAAQDALGIPRGTIRATVLIETILAAFQMEEILYELREHSSGLNAGRWDYLFSTIKVFRADPAFVLPDRVQVTMAVPFMRAYTELLAKTCHRRSAHAIGGMAAFIPNRRDPELNATALTRVREDKQREANAGFDGAWVAHPDLVPIVKDVFAQVLGERPNQITRQRDDVAVTRDQLLDVRVPGGRVTEGGVRTNVSVALQYLDGWLRGSGAVAINNLMEDTATAEISRAQLWQWIRHGVTLDNGERMTGDVYRRVAREELASLETAHEASGSSGGSRLRDAAGLLDELVLTESFVDFLTIAAYARLD